MDKIDLSLPTMYGDHHIIEVRRILLALPGIENVYASSSLQVVQIHFDANIITADNIRAALQEAGYTESLPVPAESGVPTTEDPSMNRYFRHTTAYAQVNSTVSFAQHIAPSGPALWPCPGMGVIKTKLLEDDVGDG